MVTLSFICLPDGDQKGGGVELNLSEMPYSENIKFDFYNFEFACKFLFMRNFCKC